MEATIILAKCGKTGLSYGMRVQKMEDGDWWRTWAFPIKERQAKNEGYDKSRIRGNLCATSEYPGCPYCRAMSFVVCDCGKISCWQGERQMKCHWCGTWRENISYTSDMMSFSGGDM